MSAEVIATVAVGAPATLIAVIAYWASRSKDQAERQRRMFADLIAPVQEQIRGVKEDVQELKDDVQGLRRNDRP